MPSLPSMQGEESRTPLTHEERIKAFKRAVGKSCRLWRGLRHLGSSGMTDAEVRRLLERRLGIMGGSCARGELYVCYQGAGLKIWADREYANPYRDNPILEGAATIRMAREVYGIPDSADMQLTLF